MINWFNDNYLYCNDTNNNDTNATMSVTDNDVNNMIVLLKKASIVKPTYRRH